MSKVMQRGMLFVLLDHFTVLILPETPPEIGEMLGNTGMAGVLSSFPTVHSTYNNIVLTFLM
jgi:hypothetical protein